MRRFLELTATVVRVMLVLMGESLAYLARLVLDLVAIGRIVWLRRILKRSASQAPVVEDAIARLRAARASRWVRWDALPPSRRLTVHATTVLMLVAAGMLGWMRLNGLTGSTQQRLARPVPSASEGARATSRPGARPQASTSNANAQHSVGMMSPDDVLVTFHRDVSSARAGTWIKAGGRNAAPLLAPGRLGEWNDFKVDSPIVIAARDGSYQMWYRGCQFSGGEYACGVGHATSPDGIVWTPLPRPVFVPDDAFARSRLDTIAVASDGRSCVMWYSVEASWFDGRKQAVIYAAYSTDGLAWTAGRDPVYTAVGQARRLRPTAAWDGSMFHLWFVDSRSPLDPSTNRFPEMPSDGDDMLFHYTSQDGRALTLAGSAPIQPLRIDPLPMSIVRVASGGFRALLYVQSPLGMDRQGIVVLRSPDGSTWEKRNDEAMPLGVSDLGSRTVPTSVTALDTRDGLLAWFVARQDRGSEAVVAALRKEDRQ